ncbi:MAG TPA: hypothetical protein VMY98_00460 [Anaerolineae bacterium]|nr:hypothetical protein [Anaerolineae bacterium]
MVATMTLAEFYRYIRENRKRIADVYREIEEIQYQFNSLYEQQAVERQALIVTYAPLLQDAEDLSGEMARLLAEQEQMARAAIEEEIAKLKPEIAEKRGSGDDLIQEAQRRVADLRKQNPILDQQEEELKARHATLQNEVEQLDAEIKKLNRFPIGWLTNAIKLRRLRKQRLGVFGNARDVERGIRIVRKKWQADKKALQDKQADLRNGWQVLSVEVSQLQSRLDHLTANIDQQSKHNAAQHLLSDLQELPIGAGSWKPRLDPLVELNRNEAIYRTGLRTVSEILGLLKGLGEGIDRFIRSVGTVYEEQRRYKLSPLQVRLSTAVTSFYDAWPEFQSKVKDEKYLGTHPLEFSQRVQDLTRERLSENAIKRMFKDMGDALAKATKAWH